MDKSDSHKVLKTSGPLGSVMHSSARKALDLFTAGNALMEATIRSDEAMLKTVGLPKGGMLLTDAAKMIGFEAKWRKDFRSFVPAGAECNVATGMACLGGSAYFTGRIGCDDAGDNYQNRLRELGVEAGLVRGMEHTGRILSFVTPDGERSMLTHLGEAIRFSPEDIDTRRIASSRVVFISAFFFQPEPTRATAFRVVESARDCGIPIAFDVSDATLIRDNGDLIRTVVEHYADIVFLNEAEAQALGAVCDEQPESYLRKHVSTFLVKKGGQGATVFSEEETFHVGALPTDVVDSTGAGDAFAAGFLFASLQGCGPADAGKAGCHLASRVVTQYGSCLSCRHSN